VTDFLGQFILISFGGWRIGSLLVEEEGPFEVFARFRGLIGIPRGAGEIKGVLPQLFSCVWCLSVWISAALWGLWQVTPEPVLIFAAAGGILAIERWINVQSNNAN